MKRRRIRTGRLLFVVLVLALIFGGSVYYLTNKVLPSRTKIMLDPGHDITQPGYVTDLVNEQEYCLDIAQRVQTKMAADKQFDVYLSYNPEEGESSPLTKRIPYFEKVSPDSIISIHLTMDIDRNYAGTRILCVPPKAKNNKKSVSLGQALAGVSERECAVQYLNYQEIKPGIYQKVYTELDEEYPEDAETQEILELGYPAVQIELFNVSAADTVEWFLSEEGREAAADWIVKGITAYYE